MKMTVNYFAIKSSHGLEMDQSCGYFLFVSINCNEFMYYLNYRQTLGFLTEEVKNPNR